MAGHTRAHVGFDFFLQDIAFRYRTMTCLTFSSGVGVELMAKKDETRDLVHPDPGDRLLGRMKLRKFLDVRRFFLYRDVARHALLGFRDRRLLAGGRHRVAFGALQHRQFRVGLMREGKRLLGRQYQ